MPRGGIPIGKVFGISFRLDYSWFFIFALVTWVLAGSYFPSAFPSWSLALKIGAGVLTSLLFFGSVLAHELMHSLVARREGIPVQSITLFILGGVSQMTEEPKRPKDELRMAAAGPVSSLVLGGIFWGINFLAGAPVSPFQLLVGATSTVSAPFSPVQLVWGVTSWLGYINLVLGVFNFVPGFPLDGGRVLRSIMWWRSGNLQSATKVAADIGRAIGFLFIFGGILLFFTGNLFNGVWFVLLGWFLESAAGSSYRQVLMQDMLKGHVAGEVMSRDCTPVSPDITVEQLVNENILTSGRRCFPVVSGGRVEGLMTLHNVRIVPKDQWKTKRVREAMTPLDKLKAVKPSDDLNTVFQILAQNDINQVPVVSDQSVVGIVGRDNIINFINVKSELNK